VSIRGLYYSVARRALCRHARVPAGLPRQAEPAAATSFCPRAGLSHRERLRLRD
jgi:hypothetical protein